jgi:hypothetical protein
VSGDYAPRFANALLEFFRNGALNDLRAVNETVSQTFEKTLSFLRTVNM